MNPLIAMMGADVVRKGGRYCVTHSRTGAVLKRKGRRQCFDSRSVANRVAAETRCRVLGSCPRRR